GEPNPPSRNDISFRCLDPSARINQISCPASANSAPLRNTICEPSGETEADQPSSLNCRGLPPRMDRDHRRLFAGGAAQDANNCELSGNHPRHMTSETFDSRGWSS